MIPSEYKPGQLVSYGDSLGFTGYDGGPAFPNTMSADFEGRACPVKTSHSHEAYITSIGGMSLRDWFAGQALVGMAAGEYWRENFQDSPPGYLEDVARVAYAAADAMIKAREITK